MLIECPSWVASGEPQADGNKKSPRDLSQELSKP